MATLESLEAAVNLQGKQIDVNSRTIEEQRQTIVGLKDLVVNLDKYIRENLIQKRPTNGSDQSR